MYRRFAAVLIASAACQLSLPSTAAADCREEPCSARRHNGAGGLSVQAVWLNTDPIAALARTDRYLRGESFDLDNRITPMVGLTSYRESDAGVRTGGGVWAGYKLYQSAAYSRADSSGILHDSVTALRLIPVYGGFSLEKALRFRVMDAHAGALVGGGAYLAHRTAIDVDDPSVFREPDTASANQEGRWGAAGFGTLELNAGVAVTVAPVLQIGLDGVLSMVYSPEGFGVGYGDFYSVSPGVRLRLLFGRA